MWLLDRCFPYIASLIEKFELTGDGPEQSLRGDVRAIAPRYLRPFRSKSRASRLDSLGSEESLVVLTQVAWKMMKRCSSHYLPLTSSSIA